MFKIYTKYCNSKKKNFSKKWEILSKAKKMEKNNLNKNVVLITAAIASFIIPFMGLSINVALPTIGKTFAIDAINLSWITTIFLLTSAMFALPFGKIADIKGRKKIFTYGLILVIIGSITAGLSNSAGIIIASRAIQGFGGAMLFVTALTIIISVFPDKERGKAIGINVGATYLGGISGPVIGGILTNYLSWRSIFFFCAIIGLISLILTLTELKNFEIIDNKNVKLDIKGSIIYMLMLGLILWGFSNITKSNGLIFLTLGIIFFVIFIIIESRTEDSLLNMNLFKNNRTFTFSNIATFISFVGLYAVIGSVEKKDYNIASATVSTMRLIGQTFGLGICILIFSIYIGSTQITPNQYPAFLISIKITFIIAAILSIIAIFASLERTNKNKGISS